MDLMKILGEKVQKSMPLETPKSTEMQIPVQLLQESFSSMWVNIAQKKKIATPECKWNKWNWYKAKWV